MGDLHEPVVLHPRAKGGSARGAQISVRRVRDLILAGIRAGDLGSGSLDEARLMSEFSASRGAVRSALNHLSALGVLERRPRFGTRVADSGIRLALADIVGPVHQGVRIDVLEQRLVPATPLLQQRLRVGEGLVRMVENSFLFGDDVIGLRTAYFSQSVMSDPVELNGRPQSMESIIRGFFSSEPGAAYVWVGAELADARTSKILGVAEGSCLLRRELTYLDSDDEPIEVVFDAFRADRVSFDQGPFELS